MRAKVKQYQGENENMLATAIIVSDDSLDISGFKIIKSKFDGKPVVYPPTYKATNSPYGYDAVSRKDPKWKEAESLILDEFNKECQKFKKKL